MFASIRKIQYENTTTPAMLDFFPLWMLCRKSPTVIIKERVLFNERKLLHNTSSFFIKNKNEDTLGN